VSFKILEYPDWSSPAQAAPQPYGPLRRLVDSLRWPVKRWIGHDSSVGFGMRLFLALAVTLAAIGVVAYLEIDHRLQRLQIHNYAALQRADADGFQDAAAGSAHPAESVHQIDQLLNGVEGRPGVLEAVLIDQRQIVRAAGSDRLNGTRDPDPRILAALRHGTSYAGHQSDPRENRGDLEVVTPVSLPSGRYAYAVTYDQEVYAAQLNEVLGVLVWVGTLALVGGAGVFYLTGGRALLRSHRIALRRATRDGLTDLPNQRAFQDELPRAAASATRYGNPLALAVLDVDDFKLVNDRRGHPQGDAVLLRIAAILSQGRPADRAYRTGGDEFALVLPHADGDGAGALARRLSRRCRDAGVQVSIGVSTLRPGQAADALRAEADSALYEAKRQGGDRIAYFEDIRDQVRLTTPDRRDAVHRLIEEGRLTTVFQPIWDLESGMLLGVEALTRPDPSYGLSGPAEAFDVAEQIGRVHQLDVLCAQNALRTAPRLPAGALLFINLAPQTLDLDAAGNDWLREAVQRAALIPARVVVEVTERFGGRTAAVVKCLRRLREHGFQVALDDVGTGNSGLEMLSQIGADFVKLDQSIVAAAVTEPGARAVLMAMATFARQTGAYVIAEGIADQDTLEFLRDIEEPDLRSDTVIQGGQGYELGRPAIALPPEPPSALGEKFREGLSAAVGDL
jgi:diguanylate cyclase (GGDEF)-like protein